MTITRTTQGWECSTIKDGHLIHTLYIGYTKSEARAAFLYQLATSKEN